MGENCRTMMSKEKLKIEEIQNQLITLTGDFCREHIDEEYAELCEKLINKMSRKRTVSFLLGKTEIWAAAIIHSIGGINFLFDKNTQPYVGADFICEYFGVSKSTVGQKAKVIRDMFKMNHFDPEFSTQSIAQQNPFDRLTMVNGFLVMLDR
jgi:hypothetical protein